MCYDKQSYPISRKTLSHLVFWPQDQENKLHQKVTKKTWRKTQQTMAYAL